MAAADARSCADVHCLPGAHDCPFCNWERNFPKSAGGGPDVEYNDQQEAKRAVLRPSARPTVEEKQGHVRKIFDQCIVFLAMAEFAALLIFMLPSDIVAFLACAPSYGTHRVLLHYAAFLFKYPTHQFCLKAAAEQGVLKVDAWRDDHRQKRLKVDERAPFYFVVISKAVRSCAFNRYETSTLDQRSKGIRAIETPGAGKRGLKAVAAEAQRAAQ